MVSVSLPRMPDAVFPADGEGARTALARAPVDLCRWSIRYGGHGRVGPGPDHRGGGWRQRSGTNNPNNSPRLVPVVPDPTTLRLLPDGCSSFTLASFINHRVCRSPWGLWIGPSSSRSLPRHKDHCRRGSCVGSRRARPAGYGNSDGSLSGNSGGSLSALSPRSPRGQAAEARHPARSDRCHDPA